MKLDSRLQVIEFLTERDLVPVRSNNLQDARLHASNVGAPRLRCLCSAGKQCHRAVNEELLTIFCHNCLERHIRNVIARQIRRLARQIEADPDSHRQRLMY